MYLLGAERDRDIKGRRGGDLDRLRTGGDLRGGERTRLAGGGDLHHQLRVKLKNILCL